MRDNFEELSLFSEMLVIKNKNKNKKKGKKKRGERGFSWHSKQSDVDKTVWLNRCLLWSSIFPPSPFFCLFLLFFFVDHFFQSTSSSPVSYGSLTFSLFCLFPVLSCPGFGLEKCFEIGCSPRSQSNHSTSFPTRVSSGSLSFFLSFFERKEAKKRAPEGTTIKHFFHHSISNEVRGPAELKHINKRRKRN